MKLGECGEQCPKPVIDAKRALESCNPGETVEVLVDNEIAVQNLSKMAANRGPSAVPEKISDNKFSVKTSVGQGVTPASGASDDSDEEPATCLPDSRKKGMTAVLSSNLMGHGDPELGKALMKGFVYVLTQQDVLPEAILLYNSGAYPFYEGSDNLEDLKSMESQGVETFTCGTCLNFYGLNEKLRVGSVINMYEIAKRVTIAKLLVRPQTFLTVGLTKRL